VLYYDMLMCYVSLSIVAHLNILNCNVYPQSIIVIPLEVYFLEKGNNIMTWPIIPKHLFCGWPLACSVCSSGNIVCHSSVMTLHRVANKCTSNTMGVTNEQKLITVSQHLRKARLLMGLVFYISYIYLPKLWCSYC
jgi:hypothetical protein